MQPEVLSLWRPQPNKITVIFGRRISKHYRGKLQTEIEDMDLPNPVIRSHYGHGFIKQYVRDRLMLRTEAASNNVNDSWLEDVEMHTACLTPDGVLLRLIIDGQIVAEARSVLYTPQPPELFEIPAGYEPALAPGGGPVD